MAAKTTDNLWDPMRGKPSIETDGCAFCGRYPVERHHIIPRSHGGGSEATITVCGFGNTSGCHGRLHDHTLHIRWNGGWEWLSTPTPTKEWDALEMEGWSDRWRT